MSPLTQFLSEHPVFTAAEFAAFRSHVGSENPVTHRAMLAQYESRGRILRVRRGLYAVVPPGATPETASVDPYLVAAKLAPDAALSHHTALELHGYAYSTFERYTFLTKTAARAVQFRALRFQPVLVPRSLRNQGREDFGVTSTDRRGQTLRVTSLERTLVDALARPGLAGGWEETWRSLESVPYFDLDIVVQYTGLLGGATTAAKVGWFLDENAKRLMAQPEHLQELRELRPKSPHYVDRHSKHEHRYVREWNLVVPAHLADAPWREVE